MCAHRVAEAVKCAVSCHWRAQLGINSTSDVWKFCQNFCLSNSFPIHSDPVPATQIPFSQSKNRSVPVPILPLQDPLSNDVNIFNLQINGLINYMDPSRLVSGSQDGNESQAQSDQPTEYAEASTEKK